MLKIYQSKWLKSLNLTVLLAVISVIFPLKICAQTPPSGVDLPDDASDTIERTAPKPDRSTPSIPQQKPKPNLQVPNVPQTSKCLASDDGRYSEDFFYVRDVEVLGNTVLEAEINTEISRFKRRTATLEDLVCLRSKITNLYLNNGYITSGAFIPNNQDLTSGVVQIQVVEGEVSQIEIGGLKRLKPGYVRSRLLSATNKPLNRDVLEDSLQILLQNPLIDRVDAELTASNTSGSNILSINIKEADAFFVDINADNYRSASIGEAQLTAAIAHNNILGFGDRISTSYSLTEGLDLFSIGYTIPWNAQDGTFSFSYSISDSDIVEDEFEDFNIASESESVSFVARQPIIKSPNTEFALSFNFDLRSRQTFLDGDSFPFTIGLTDGISNATVLRFTQEWLNRQPTRVFAVRSQFSVGIDAFDATINDFGTDGSFFAWQGQFQWLQRLSPRVLLVTRVGTQLTPDSLLSFEKFSLGGINTVRGYSENFVVTDNGVLGSVELRLPLTLDPQTLQLSSFFDVGTGWDNEALDSDLETLASVGLGLRWLIAPNLETRLDYGIPLIDTDDDGDSLQENGIHWSLNYQLF